MAINDPNTIPAMLDLKRWTATLSGASLPNVSIKSMLKNREIGRRSGPASHRPPFVPNTSSASECPRSYHASSTSNTWSAFTLSERANLANRFLPNQWDVIAITDSELFRCSHLQNNEFLTLDNLNSLRFYIDERSEYELASSVHLPNAEGDINDLTHSARGDRLAYATSDAYLYHCNLGEVRNNLNWRVFHTTPLPIVRGWESYFSLCYTSDGEHVIVGGSGGYVSIIGVDQHSHHSFCAHRSDVKAIHCSKADRHFFCTGSTDGSCKLWDDRALYNNIPVAVCTGDGYSISHIDGDSYDRYICATTVGGAITIWDSRRFSQNSLFNVQQEEAIQRGGAYSNIALKMEGQNTLEIFWRAKFSPEGTGHRYIYCGSGSGHVYIFDIMTGEVIRLFRKCKAEVQDCSWNPNDNEVISVALCGSTSRWYCKEEGSDGLMSEVCYH